VEGDKFTTAGDALQLNGEPQTLTFSPDNKWLAGGSSSGFAYLWDIATTQEMTRIPHNDPVTSVSFSPDGPLLLTVSRKVVRVWNITSLPLVPKDQLITFACSHLTSNFSTDEWNVIFGNEEYRPICPDLQEGK
jgi:WD40 repeat protein